MLYKPQEGHAKGWLIDECHRLTPDAQSALLKSLEDTAKNVYFVLCTTDPDKLLPTLRNRCDQYQVDLLKDREILEILRTVCKKEDLQTSVDNLKLLAKAAKGCARQGLVLLEKIQGLDDSQIEHAIADILISEAKVIDLCRALVDKKKDWLKVTEILTGLKNENPESLRIAVIKYFETVLTKDAKPNYGAYWTMRSFYRYPTYSLGMSPIKIACFESVFMVSDEEQ